MRRADDWVYDARLVLGTISRVWGGAGAIMLPWRDGSVDDVLLGLARSHDPDCLAAMEVTFADWSSKDSAGFEAWAGGQSFVTEAADPEAARQELSRQLADQPLWQEDAPAELVGRLFGICAPHRWHDISPPAARSLHPRRPVGGPLTDVQALASAWPSGEDLWTLDLSGLDPALALMIETRIGRYNSVDGLGEVLQVPVAEAELDALVSLAVAGDIGFAAWDLPNRFQQAIGSAVQGTRNDPNEVRRRLRWTPFPRSVTGLVELNYGDFVPHAVLVVGDSMDDYALALAYDRLSWRGSWLPARMTDPADEHFRRVRRAVAALRRDPAVNRLESSRLFVTSNSLDADHLGRIAEALTDGEIGRPGRGVAAMQVVTPADLPPLQGRKLWADPERYATSISIPVAADDTGAVEFLTAVDLPTPSELDAAAIPDLHWEVDIDVAGHRLPARTVIGGGRLLAEDGPWRLSSQVRAGAAGVAVHSHSQGLVFAGSPLSLRMARPRLSLPGAAGVIRALAEAAGVSAQLSAAGRRAAAALALWPDLHAMAADLRGPVRRLLDAFTPPQDICESEYPHGLAVHGQGYLRFGHAARALGAGRAATRSTLDRLLSHRVLRRGLLLRCERCAWLAHYPVDALAQRTSCARCGHPNELLQQRWRLPAHEPAWFYDLDQLIRDLLAHDGDIPLLTIDMIDRDNRRSILVEHELELTRTGATRPFVEIDICVVADGRILVGEGKTAGAISTDQIGKLAQAAAALTADEVHLATAQAAWTPPTISTLRTALVRAYESLNRRPPEIRQWTQVRDSGSPDRPGPAG